MSLLFALDMLILGALASVMPDRWMCRGSIVREVLGALLVAEMRAFWRAAR